MSSLGLPAVMLFIVVVVVVVVKAFGDATIAQEIVDLSFDLMK
jgi:hypothetical protein